jgi:hypothetical protein
MTQIQTPEGVVEFPDNMSKADIENVLRQRYPAKKSSDGVTLQSPRGGTTTMPADDPRIPFLVNQRGWVVRGPSGEADIGATAADVAKSVGTRLGEMGIGIAGGLGTAQELLSGGAGWLSEKTGIGEPETVRKTLRGAPILPGMTVGALPSGSDIQGGVETVTGPFYEPKTRSGETAATIADYAANAVIPGGLVRKTLSVALPVAAKEATREFSRRVAPSTESYLPDIAGLVTSIPAASMFRPSVPKIISKQKNLPTLPEIEALTDDAYNQLRAAGIKYDANAYDNLINEIRTDLHKTGKRAITSPRAHGFIDELNQYRGGSPDFSDLDSIRQAAGDFAFNTSDSVEAGAAKMIWNKIGKFMSGAPMINTTGKTGPEITGMMARARDLASRKIKAEQLTKMAKKAEGYVSGEASGLRRQFGALTTKLADKPRGFTETERQAIETVHKGTPGQRLASWAGSTGADIARGAGRSNLLPALVGSGAATAGYAIGGYPGAAIASLAQQGLGMGAKAAALGQTRKAAQRAVQTALAGRAGQAAAEAQRIRDFQAMLQRLGITGLLGTQAIEDRR